MYGPPAPNGAPSSNGMPGSASQTPLPSYARQPDQQQPEIRPLVNHPGTSSGGPRTPFEHHAQAAPGIASGAPAPSSAQTAADAAARERDDRPPSAAPPKRMREWEDEPSSSKKPSTDESRSRLDEIKMHRSSPPEKMATPPNHSPSELRRLDDQRPTSAYHPSEAAHHPPSLPSMQSITQPSPSASAPPQEEQRAPPPAPPPAPVYEPAARKMDVDENYDDSGDDKSATKQESQRSSPKAGNGAAPAAVVAAE
jgi:general transcriptional corepressor CYC8